MASLTKSLITATAIMQLFEQGKLRLDDPVAAYLPAFAEHGKADITVRELLTHYSGLPADLDLSEPWTGKEEGYRRAMDSTPVTAAGAQFRYSDINFITLGANRREALWHAACNSTRPSTSCDRLGFDTRVFCRLPARYNISRLRSTTNIT